MAKGQAGNKGWHFFSGYNFHYIMREFQEPCRGTYPYDAFPIFNNCSNEINASFRMILQSIDMEILPVEPHKTVGGTKPEIAIFTLHGT